jgi:hypothetical protein
MTVLTHDQVRLQRMVRGTLLAIRKSKEVVRETKKLLEKSQVPSQFRIKRPEIRIEWRP